MSNATNRYESQLRIAAYTDKFDIPSWHALVDYIKIMPDKNIIFHLRNGCEETVPLAEVQ